VYFAFDESQHSAKRFLVMCLDFAERLKIGTRGLSAEYPIFGTQQTPRHTTYTRILVVSGGPSGVGWHAYSERDRSGPVGRVGGDP